MNDNSPTDPQKHIWMNGHLPVSGELGVDTGEDED
jgi:hypothetical protein